MRRHYDINPKAPKPTDRWDLNYTPMLACGRPAKAMMFTTTDTWAVTCKLCRERISQAERRAAALRKKFGKNYPRTGKMKPLSLAQSDVLDILAKVAYVTPHSVSKRTLEALWRRGLVSRQGDVYRLTEAGKDARKPTPRL